jgi:Domain of unknown function (DUF4407)
MKKLLKLLESLSGADARILNRRECQGERRIYQGVGMTIAITGICACISAGYAFYSIFKVIEVSIFLGSFWGFAIAMIDRFLIMTTSKKSQLSWTQFGIVASRIGMATLIAIVISKPLEMAIFSKEIQANIVAEVQRQQTSTKLPEFLEIDRLRKENQNLQTNDEQLSQKYQRAYDQSIGEAEGTSGTNKMGKGPVFQEKQKELQRQKKILDETAAQNRNQIKANQQKIKTLEKALNLKLQQVQKAALAADGILGQMQMLHKMAEKDSSVAWASYLISAIFVAIDVLPILGKLTMKPTIHDAIQHYETTAAIKRQEAYTANVQQEIDQEMFHQRTVQDNINSFISEGLADAIEQVPHSPLWKNTLAKAVWNLAQRTSEGMAQAIGAVRFPHNAFKHIAKKAVRKEMPNLARDQAKSQIYRHHINTEVEDIVNTAEQAVHKFNQDN